MTDPRDKQRMRDRYGKASKHVRSREEEQQLADARRARARQRPTRTDDDGDADFVKMRRRDRVLDDRPRAPAVVPNSAELVGTVVWLSRGRARVRCGDDERDAVLAADLAATQQSSIAVGDEVVLHERAGAEPVVATVLPRRSALVRVDPGNAERRRVLAANVDLVVLVLTADRPRLGLIDRLRVALADSGAAFAVCVNKQDLLPDDDAHRALVHQLEPHVRSGVDVFVASALRGDGIEALQALLRGRAVAFVGHSGVGKSTLLNRLDPEHGQRRTAEVRAHDGKGRHTTTASSLTVLADGTRLVDTPGVRAFGLPEGHSDAIAAFADVAAFADGCRFHDCRHQQEPGCAVRAAVERGELAEARYRAWLRIDP